MFHLRAGVALRVLVLVAGLTAVAARAEEPPAFLTTWGRLGTGPGEFQSCSDVAIGPSGTVYVADFANSRIQRFKADGTYLDEWPTPPVDAAVVYPRSIALDADENVYVVDQGNSRIQKYTSTGSLVTMWGEWGEADGRLRWPSGIAVGPDGHVYVADSNNFRIQEFSTSGTHVRTIGALSTPPVSLGLVGGVAVDGLGNIFASSVNTDRIVKLGPGGDVLAQWGTQGSADGEFDSPGDPCVDRAGNVYVVEQVFPPFQPCNHRAQKFSNDGTFLSRWGDPGTSSGQFNDPHGIAVDAAGHVYIADTQNNRVQKFGADATVAIALSDFEALPKDAGVQVRWSAALAGDATFAIWRAEDPGNAFQRIGEIRGRRGERTFSFTDTATRPLVTYSYKLGYRDGAEWAFTEAIGVATGAAAGLLLEAGPNPSRGGVGIAYSILRGDRARLEVFDVSGARIRTLQDRAAAAGTASLWWNGLDERGVAVPAGRYFVRLVTNGSSRTRSIVLLR